MDNNKSKVYVNDICIWCTHNNECNHDRFIVTKFLDRTTMRCAGYEYNRLPEQNTFIDFKYEI